MKTQEDGQQNKFYVTLKSLRQKQACYSGYNKVVRALQGKEFTEEDGERKSYIRFAHKEPISIRSIIDSNNLDDALWALRCIHGADNDKDIRLFGVWCARQVEHLMTDQRSKEALNVAERYAHGDATADELDAAGAAARAAAWAAAGAAARAAAGAAARAAAWDAARAAARAAAWAAARAAAWDAARAAAGDAQKARLIEMLEAGHF